MVHAASFGAALGIVLLLICSCVYISEDRPEGTTETSVFSQCEAAVESIQCGFPLELHVTFDDDGCSVVCEPPACPVDNIFCVNALCSICLPATVDFPLEQCQTFLQSCDPMDLEPSADSSTSDEGSSGLMPDTGGSTASDAVTGTTGTAGIDGTSGMPLK